MGVDRETSEWCDITISSKAIGHGYGTLLLLGIVADLRKCKVVIGADVRHKEPLLLAM